MKTHELKIINTSLVWIRRGYFDSKICINLASISLQRRWVHQAV